jgi:AcrR family transcriptional regulator
MASRKTKPREKKTSQPVAHKTRAGRAHPAEPAHDDLAKTDEHPLRPSSTTRELEAATVAMLAEHSTHAASVPAMRVALAAAPTTPELHEAAPRPAVRARQFDDLAQTIEAPATAPRVLLLDAGEAVINELGFPATTDAEIARCAGVSIDVFHAHFASKSALLYALSERFCAQTMSLTDDATRDGIWDRATAREVIEVAVRSILDVILGRAGLVRAVLASGDEKMLDGFRRVGAHIAQSVTRVIESTHTSPEERPDPRDVAFALLLAIALAHHAIVLGTESSGLDFERSEIFERVAQAINAYLDARRAS